MNENKTMREIELIRENAMLEAKLRRYEQLLKIIDGECQQFLTDIEPKQTEQTEPLTAHWIISSDGYYPYCSYCHGEPTSGIRTKYCPDCGRRMEDYK